MAAASAASRKFQVGADNEDEALLFAVEDAEDAIFEEADDESRLLELVEEVNISWNPFISSSNDGIEDKVEVG